MSHRQYGTLKYIREHIVHTSHVRTLNLTTFGSLFQRNFIHRNGNLIELTKLGEDQFQLYHRAAASFRKHEGEISERVALMLSLKITRIDHKKAS